MSLWSVCVSALVGGFGECRAAAVSRSRSCQNLNNGRHSASSKINSSAEGMKGGDLDKETGKEVVEEKATETPLGYIGSNFCLALVVTTQEDRIRRQALALSLS